MTVTRGEETSPLLLFRSEKSKQEQQQREGSGMRANSSKRLVLSFAIWLVSYYFMAIFGGSVAFYRFPREPTSAPEPYTLGDIGFHLLPEYCPKPLLHLNMQSAVLVLFYLHALLWALWHRASGRGALLLTRFFLLNSLVFVTRTSVVGLTALPQPNFGKHCTHAQVTPISFLGAVWEVCGSFPPKACGDLIYSGHVACVFTALFIFESMSAFPSVPHGVATLVPLPPQLPRFLCYLLGGLATLSCLLCRSHYTVDVMLGLYFSYFLGVFYLQRAQGVVVGGRLGGLIRYLEGGTDGDRRGRDGGSRSSISWSDNRDCCSCSCCSLGYGASSHHSFFPPDSNSSSGSSGGSSSSGSSGGRASTCRCSEEQHTHEDDTVCGL